jgi:hypothetical protein
VHAVNADEVAYPVPAGFLGTAAVVASSNRLSDAVPEFRWMMRAIHRLFLNP